MRWGGEENNKILDVLCELYFVIVPLKVVRFLKTDVEFEIF